MNEIFINYRKEDEEASATLIERELSHRFGSEQVFRASKSIPRGADYRIALLTAARESKVLLAVIGPGWLTAVNTQGRKRLNNRGDWTRREILEAFEHGVPVIPVLVGDTPLLDPSKLPPKLARLANCQYYRLYHRSAEANLRTLGDELVKLVPSLAAHDRTKEATEPDVGGRPGSTTLRAGDHAHQQTSDAYTVFKNSSGPVHSGTGPQYNNSGTGPQFNDSGVNYAAGDNRGKMRQKFDSRRERPDDER